RYRCKFFLSLECPAMAPLPLWEQGIRQDFKKWGRLDACRSVYVLQEGIRDRSWTPRQPGHCKGCRSAFTESDPDPPSSFERSWNFELRIRNWWNRLPRGRK